MTINQQASRTEHDREYVQTTLLELVSTIADVADTDAEVVAVVYRLMEEGRVRLNGHFTERDFGFAA